MKWLNGIWTPRILLYFLKIVRSRVSCEHGEAAPRSQSWSKTRHVTSDALKEVQWLSRSKHIYLHGKDLFINL